MKYGLIGEHLKHSFSKVIHEQIGDYVYEIKELEPEALESFIRAREFSAINVTIPYKEKVMPFLDYIDDSARKIGAVNTVVNKNGRLYGYNTDYLGMKALTERIGIMPKGKKVLIIGTGGTSKTARAVLSDMGAREIIFVSNIKVEGAYSYEEIYKNHKDVEIIFNTSPVGMYPRNEGIPIDLGCFPRLEALLDVVYNPIRTSLVLQAQKMGIIAEGGLYMLVAQAVYAYEYFMDTKIDKSICDKIYNSLLKEKDNVVLIGMPASGKTTVGRLIAEKTGKELIDTDELIVKNAKMTIPEIFEKYSEQYFRDLEAEAVAEASKKNGVAIATGGGAILREENVKALKQNGRLYFLDRSLNLLIPTEDRPLSSTREAIERRYNERYGKYLSSADFQINGDGTPTEVADLIYKEWNK